MTEVWPIATFPHPVHSDWPGKGLGMETSQWEGIPGLWLEPQRRSLHSRGLLSWGASLQLRGGLLEQRVSKGEGRVKKWRERETVLRTCSNNKEDWLRVNHLKTR